MAESGDSSQERELEPSERRIIRAREQGQLPQSRDIATFALLTVFIIFLIAIGPLLLQQLVLMTKSSFVFAEPIKLLDHIQEWLNGPLLVVLGLLSLVFLPVWLVGILAPLSLVNFRAYFAPKFDMGRLDFIAGLGRMVSLNALTELIKNILKTALVLGIGITYLVGLFVYIRTIVSQDFDSALLHTSYFILNGFLLLMVPLLLIAVGDAWMQWFNFRKQIRMSPEEMKQEMKESEGSPEIKQRLRQRQRQIASSRMMAAIERADVVLANPEHYSVALRYDIEKMAAPIVIAKGADQIALRIQEVAREHDVPIAQIPPLARYLYSQLEIGEAIPMSLFEAIAKILAWAYEVKESGGVEGEIPEVSFIPEVLKPGKALL
ncbi:EscU/YscU/HrcU family type III secretion system export apparatus switch protein [Polynucleobacter sp. AP-Jannik-300A-C4]|uniref:EscU/YscU/HrcU family type III secretion system export apparatus switch protein n=1 Tax=unclassified Polynucleobacter TaxID=2640945 RepID=UPI001BFDCF39|nr:MULTISPECIES: EscU/YscU/HrcU family type III secretion system export apparatus switch protein [unclassified Polynucleobacter]QWE23092.1 EscU/YscU/HrcU family type III secretion system export apparatus switch protein [Polynucleobacter sp. AP-Jannik-300A-C4]